MRCLIMGHKARSAIIPEESPIKSVKYVGDEGGGMGGGGMGVKRRGSKKIHNRLNSVWSKHTA